MFLGRFQLGQTLPLFLVTRDGSQTPQEPSIPPVATIWSPSAKVSVAELPIIERYTQTGMFLGRQFLSSAFAVGLYQVDYYYEVGSYQGIVVDNFEIMAGGNADGNVMAMYFYRRPQANFIVQSLDSGKIVQGRNPTI